MYKVSQNKDIFPNFVLIIILNMNKSITCFILAGNNEQCHNNAETFLFQPYVKDVFLLKDNNISEPITQQECQYLHIDSPTSLNTFRKIAEHSHTPYTLLYLKTERIELGYKCLERMTSYFSTGQCGMVYSDHFQIRQTHHTA